MPVFPNHLGKFKTSQLSDGVTYEVHGDKMDSPSMEQPSSPYGAYTGAVCFTSKLPIMHTTSKSKLLRGLFISESNWGRSHKAL